MADIGNFPGVDYVTNGLNGLVIPDSEKNDDIFPEGVNILQLPNQDNLEKQDVLVVRTSRKKKVRPPREDFQTFDRMYSLSEDYLGGGSFSEVFACKRITTGKKYAAKIIAKNCALPRDRVLNEVELHHLCRKQNNILSLVQFFEERSRYIFVYPLMKGGTLLKHIEKKIVFSESKAREVVKDLSAALSFLHQHGVAHRDLKPDNILCENDEETITPVKICDFDLASGFGSWTKPVSTPVLQTPVGSAEYMAPEVVQAFVNEDEATCYDKRCDLWSLGVILYIMLSGHPPFQGNCGEDCGWDRNEACYKCQNILLNSIQGGHYNLSGDEWSHVSHEAKELISNLLVREASRRYSAEQVLHCPWSTKSVTEPNGGTPVQSPRVTFDVSSFLDDANKAIRTLAQNANIASKSDKTGLFGLSPPGSSSLAKRRACKSTIKC